MSKSVLLQLFNIRVYLKTNRFSQSTISHLSYPGEYWITLNMVHPRLLLMITFCYCLVACHNGQKSKFKPLDLASYGIPLIIMSPDSAEVMKKDYNIMRDITIRKGNNYYVQIFESTATNDVAEVKKNQLESVKQDKYFKELIQEDEHGFIFQKELDSAIIDYDFRYIKILNGREIIFQTGMIGTFSLEDVKSMYEGVRKSDE